MTADEMFEFLIECGIASNDFIDGAVCAGGHNRETAERILFYHTGYRSFEGYLGEFSDEE